MPAAFFANLTQRPGDVAWCSSSHAAHALAEGNGRTGSAEAGRLEVVRGIRSRVGSLPFDHRQDYCAGEVVVVAGCVAAGEPVGRGGSAVAGAVAGCVLAGVWGGIGLGIG